MTEDKPVRDMTSDPLQNDGPLRILHMQTMFGANYFSGGPVIVMKLDLGVYDEVFSDQIPGLYEGLRKVLPSLYHHQCSEGRPGGFFFRVKQGTLLGHITEHVAIELQTLAGMDVGFGKTRQTDRPGVYNVVFRFFDAEAGMVAGQSAVQLINGLLTGNPSDVDNYVDNLVDIVRRNRLSPFMEALNDQADRKMIPWYHLREFETVLVGSGCKRRYYDQTGPKSHAGTIVSTPEKRRKKLQLAKVHTLVTDSDHSVDNSRCLQALVIHGKLCRTLLDAGASWQDVSDEIVDETRFWIERAARTLDLPFAVVACVLNGDDPIPLVGDVSAAPDWNLFHEQSEGLPEAFLDAVFPDADHHVPLYSITGTAGKTTTAFLLRHCLLSCGKHPGLTSNEGLFVGKRLIRGGDMTYPEQVHLLLDDPTIDCAVLETTREGILRRGLGYRAADIGIVLNVHHDHVGGSAADSIHNLDDLAYVKSVVAEQVYDEGAAILNADVPLVLQMRERVWSQVILFTCEPSNEAFRDHVAKGGVGVALDQDWIVILRANQRQEVLPADQIPLLQNGRVDVNAESVLATTAALYHNGIAIEQIRQGLSSFSPDPENLPGRLNHFQIPAGPEETARPVRVILDYAHNQISFNKIQKMLLRIDGKKLGVLDAPGDRHGEDLEELGRIAGETYQSLILYEDSDLRGRKPGQIPRLIQQGIERDIPVQTAASLEAAWALAREQFEPGLVVVLLTERSTEAIELIRQAGGVSV